MKRIKVKTVYYTSVIFDDRRYEPGDFICSITIPRKRGVFYTLNILKTLNHKDECGHFIPVVDIFIEEKYRLDKSLVIPWADGWNLRINISWDISDDVGDVDVLTKVSVLIESVPIPIEDDEEDC